jgi:hypothetical protein
VPLRQLAGIHEATGLFLILHEATQRVQIVTCNVAGRSITSFVAEAKRRIFSGVSLHHSKFLVRLWRRRRRVNLVRYSVFGFVIPFGFAIGLY